MKIAIMQPYFLPYLGYFQLIHSVDTFVFFDDVNFICRGWINRNNFLNQGEKKLFTLQLKGASRNLLINQITVGNNKNKLLKSICLNYSKAPQFKVVMPLIEEVLMHDDKNLSNYLEFGLKKICGYLGYNRLWARSSELMINNKLRGQNKIITICNKLGATSYINAPGGKSLYEKNIFKEHNLSLYFITPILKPYKQFKDKFESGLSIVDVLMFNDKFNCQKLLKCYTVDLV